jgi:thioredoxin-related protein
MKKLLIIYLLSLCGCIPELPERHALKGARLPSFPILFTDSITRLNTDQLTVGKPLVLIYFGPDCSHCQALTEELIAHISQLKDVRFCFIATASLKEIKHYNEQYQLSKFDNITIGQDYTAHFVKYFNVVGTPYLAFYDREKRLIQDGPGRLSIDKIKEITHQ